MCSSSHSVARRSRASPLAPARRCTSDDPALKEALSSPAFYVGALGSKKTHTQRLERLARKGMIERRLERIHGPVGLDIGAKTPEEIAVAIMAEIVSARRLN